MVTVPMARATIRYVSPSGNDAASFPLSSYSDPVLKAVAERIGATSFKHFLPFSDSIFIVSAQPVIL